MTIRTFFQNPEERVYHFKGKVLCDSIFENGYSLIYKDGGHVILDKSFNEIKIEPMNYPTDGVYELIHKNGTTVDHVDWGKSRRRQ